MLLEEWQAEGIICLVVELTVEPWVVWVRDVTVVVVGTEDSTFPRERRATASLLANVVLPEAEGPETRITLRSGWERRADMAHPITSSSKRSSSSLTRFSMMRLLISPQHVTPVDSAHTLPTLRPFRVQSFRGAGAEPTIFNNTPDLLEVSTSSNVIPTSDSADSLVVGSMTCSPTFKQIYLSIWKQS